MQELKTVKEQAIDHLAVTEGNELDITCNLTSSQQLQIVLESEAHTVLGCTYVRQYTERMLRLTNSYNARHRQDIVEIAKASRFDKDGAA
jgi:hypothetical protein